MNLRLMLRKCLLCSSLGQTFTLKPLRRLGLALATWETAPSQGSGGSASNMGCCSRHASVTRRSRCGAVSLVEVCDARPPSTVKACTALAALKPSNFQLHEAYDLPSGNSGRTRRIVVRVRAARTLRLQHDANSQGSSVHARK